MNESSVSTEIKRLIIKVERDEDLINRIYETAFKSGFEIISRRRAVIFHNLPEEEMARSMIKFKEYCQEFQIYNARLMVLQANRKKISFERIIPSKTYPKKEILLNGKDEDDLKMIIDWLETKKPS